MEKKARCKGMTELIEALNRGDNLLFKVIIFEERTILNEPVTSWPACDVFLAFHSSGFPLEKAIEYAGLRSPFCINDVHRQRTLLSRHRVYEELQRVDVQIPPFVTVMRDSITNELLDEFAEFPDSIVVNGRRLDKPFIEKPVDADDHNVCVYFPNNGGMCSMFRKTDDNRSSEFIPTSNRVRTKGSFVYEQFFETNGRHDIKVYCVNGQFNFAATRKSPTVDGIVERDTTGREKRQLTVLTESEQRMASRIFEAFGQFVCGFDILRVNGQSYVCDVNGWSFVKGNAQYYEKCAQILREKLLVELLKHRSSSPSSL